MRSIAEWEALTGEAALTPAETKLIAAVRAGRTCSIAKTRPDAPVRDNTIRAALLHLLITGAAQDCGTLDYGVALEGAWVAGMLNLAFARAIGQTSFGHCRFSEVPIFPGADLIELSLQGSKLPGLFAQGARVRGILSLRNLIATGTVDVNSASIGGQLVCDGAILHGAGGRALHAQGVRTRGDLFLRRVTATGMVDINGAKVGGQLDCSVSTFNGAGGKALAAQAAEIGRGLLFRGVVATGTIDLTDAAVGGQLDCSDTTFNGAGDKALNAQGVRVTHALVWRKVVVEDGPVHLTAARIVDLVDDGRWPVKPGALDLDGFTYDRISGETAPISAVGRRNWLRIGAVWGGRFRPQPYTQLARVLRAMGHGGEAHKVLYWREQAVAAQVRRDLLSAPVGAEDMALGHFGREVRACASFLLDRLFRLVAGYGYYPLRALGCLLALWLVASLLAQATWSEGSFAPNSAVVLVSPDWQAELARDCMPAPVPGCEANPAARWSDKGAPGMDWDSFSAAAWGLDLVVPILSLGQTESWAPSKDRGALGWFLWWFRWVLVVAGWIVSAIGAAAVTGIMQRDRE